MAKGNRWGIAAAGFLLQMALGAVYAWSVFRAPLVKRFHWSISQVTLTFTICIFVLGVAAFFGGLWLNKTGPRTVALVGGFLYGLGVFLASFSQWDKLWWLYLSYGVIGGVGLGFGYIVPVAVLVKWFPDRRGLITGVAVGGFGAGALVTAPVATRLIQSVGVLPDICLPRRRLPGGDHGGGLLHGESARRLEARGLEPVRLGKGAARGADYTFASALKTWQWWALWFLLFLNTSAGISVISQESPMFQEMAKVTPSWPPAWSAS
jgi:OFA family oxalate/formate antiporter-like MFS transporter